MAKEILLDGVWGMTNMHTCPLGSGKTIVFRNYIDKYNELLKLMNLKKVNILSKDILMIMIWLNYILNINIMNIWGPMKWLTLKEMLMDFIHVNMILFGLLLIRNLLNLIFILEWKFIQIQNILYYYFKIKINNLFNYKIYKYYKW